MRVLYVEDNPLDADLTRRALHATAPEIDLQLVGTQREALDRLGQATRAPFDAALLDARLPDGGGLAILAHIRLHGLPLAVVVVTGSSDEATAVAALKAGADDYVVKRGDYIRRLPLTLESALQRFRAEATTRRRPLRVLYAEHSAADLDLTARHLAQHAPHIHLQSVRSAEEMLNQLPVEGEDPDHDVLLLDYRLPGMNALEALKEIYEVRRLPLPAVLVTGQGDDDVAAQTLRLGATDYLAKRDGYLFQLPTMLQNAFHRAQYLREEEALRASEERFRALVMQAPDGILLSDRGGRFVEANPAICRMLGYTRDELLAMSSGDLLGPGGQPGPETVDERPASLPGGVGSVAERRYRRKDGLTLPVEVSFTHLPDGRLQRNVRDISVRLAAEAERARLVSAVEQTADSIWMQDVDGIVTYANPAFTRVYGYDAAEIVGQFAGIVDSGVQGEAFFATIWASAKSGRTWSGTIVNRRKDGSLVEVEAVISAIHDADGQFTGFVQSDRDVTRERELEGALEREARERETIEASLARIDPATSPEEIAAAACAELTQLAGIDSAWAVGLSHDHGRVLAVAGVGAGAFPAGQRLPEALAATLFDRAETGPWAQRWRGRPEFGTFGEAITAAGLHTVIMAPPRGAHGVVGVIGLGVHDPANADGLVARLPALATFGSIIGALVAPGLESRTREQDQQAAIQAILDSSSFVPFFQPVVDLRDGTIVGYEALSRFSDGVPPDARFAAAHRAGLGIELEMATLTAAIEAAAVLPPTAYLSLNVSPRLVHAGSIGPLLAGVERPIALEITEHTAIDDYAELRRELADLVPAVRLAVDDAGAGYASFRHILELAPATVKVDMGLIRGIDGDPARQALLAGMADFAVKRRIQLVAEGIETTAELEALRALAVPFGQGYLLGRPQDGRGPGPWPARVAVGD
ncbi:MAG: EAL domain-containing protein [Chloroflexi bacterium]|nr:EAL domain-containing protein [Chloroflexota bacterium]